MEKDKNRKLKENALEDLIVEALLPMSEVIVIKDKEKCFSVFKEGVKFGIVKDKAFYLFDKNGEYAKIGRDLLLDADRLLQEATKSFWYACGKIDFLKQS